MQRLRCEKKTNEKLGDLEKNGWKRTIKSKKQFTGLIQLILNPQFFAYLTSLLFGVVDISQDQITSSFWCYIKNFVYFNFTANSSGSFGLFTNEMTKAKTFFMILEKKNLRENGSGY